MRHPSLFLVCACAAACVDAEGPVRVEHRVEPLRTSGPAYADCTFAKYYDGDHLSAVGTYDALGNLDYQADCYVDDLPIRIFETTYSGPRALVTQTAIWQNDDEVYALNPEHLRTWDGDLLIAEEEGDWQTSYHYDDDGKLLLKQWGDAGESSYEESWAWQTSPDGEQATVSYDGEDTEYRWDAGGRLLSRSDPWRDDAYTWDGDRLAAWVQSYDDGSQSLLAYHYDAAGRLERVDSDGALQSSYEWTCR